MLQEKTNLLYSLALNCPFDLGCLECPFQKLWQLDLDQRLLYIENLDDDVCEEMISIHYSNYSENFIYEGFNKNINSFRFSGGLQNKVAIETTGS